MIITFSGDPGSGKSTLAKRIAEELDMPRYYVGQIWRDLAKEAGMSVAEFNQHNENNPENDRKVDDYQRELGETLENFVIEGRTSWFLIPQSVKVYVSVEPMEGARRIFSALQGENTRNEGEGAQTVEDIAKLNAERTQSDDLRYKKFYGKECFNLENYDYVLNTTNLTIDEGFEKLLAYIKSVNSAH